MILALPEGQEWLKLKFYWVLPGLKQGTSKIKRVVHPVFLCSVLFLILFLIFHSLYDTLLSLLYATKYG